MARNLLIMFGGTEEGGDDSISKFQSVFSASQLDAKATDVLQFNLLSNNPEVGFRAAGTGPNTSYWIDSGPPVLNLNIVTATGEAQQPLLIPEIQALAQTLRDVNWSSSMSLSAATANSSARGMTLDVHQRFADRAKDLVFKYLDKETTPYDNIYVTGHSRGTAIAARFAGHFSGNAEMNTALKRLILQDPVSKNVNDEPIISDAASAVRNLTQANKEVHIISRGRDSNVGVFGGGSLREYETYGSELMGSYFFYYGGGDRLDDGSPNVKIFDYPLNDASRRNGINLKNVYWHLADMQHGYMMQANAPASDKDKNGNPYRGFHQGFGAYERIIDSNPWTEPIWNNTVINLDEIYRSPHLQRYLRNEGPAARSESRSVGFFSTASRYPWEYPTLPSDDPLSGLYNAISTPIVGTTPFTDDKWGDRRAAAVHALAYKVLVPTVELSINRTESVEAREAEVTITATSNRVFNTPQRVKLKPSVGTATEGVDFTSLPASREITIPANEKSGSISFKVKDDGLIETPDETVTFEIDPNGVFHDTPLVPGGIQGLVKTGKESATFKIIDDDKAGLKIEQSNGFTEVAEGVGGKTDTYTVALTSEPSAPVTVTLTPDAQVNMAPATLTFDSSNWKTPQTVTVTAVTDGLEALNHTGSITHTMAGGADYTGLAPVPLTVKVMDDQVVNIELEETEGSTQIWESEDVFGGVMDDGPKGVVDTYTIKLNQAPAAGETVTITFTTDAQLDAIAPLTFDPSNWSDAQTVSVKAINDQDLEDFFHTGLITHAASSSDPASPFNGASVRDVNVTIQDDDTPTVTIVESGGSTEVSEDGKTDTYTLVLDSKPRKDVKIEFDTDVQLEEIASITFTPANWDQPQTVTVKAVDDADFEDLIHDSEIFHFVSSDDPLYDDIFIPDVTVKIAENDILTPPKPPSTTPPAPVTEPKLVVTDPPSVVTPENGEPGSEEVPPPTVPDGQPEPLVLQTKSTKDAVRTLRLDNPGTAPLTLDRLTFAPSLTNFPPGSTAENIFVFSLSQNPIPPGGKADLVVRLRDDLPPGEYAGIFSALTNLPGAAAIYNFPLRATVSLPLAREVAEANKVPALDPFPETAGDDEIFGSLFDEDGPQWLNGSLGDDLINGNLGNDVLTGGPGNDTVYGGQGDDFIRGALGDDVLFGDLGNDTLIGGLGRDRFVLGAGDGSDLILDFTVDADVFLLKPELTFEQLTFVAAGNSTRIEFNGELLATVVGVPTPIVSAASFGPLT